MPICVRSPLALKKSNYLRLLSASLLQHKHWCKDYSKSKQIGRLSYIKISSDVRYYCNYGLLRHFNSHADKLFNPEEEFQKNEKSDAREEQKREVKNVEDVIFDLFKDQNKDVISMARFLTGLRETGLRTNDPRLSQMMSALKNHNLKVVGYPGAGESLILDRDSFKLVIADNIVLISKAFRGHFVIPDFPALTNQIEELFWKCKSITSGQVGTYIPQLARFKPEYWGVSLCTVDGQRFSIGDVDVPFTIQSASKPLTYATVLNECGSEIVHQYIGQEPSGRMFAELVLDYNKKPHNPMINAGAIVTASLLAMLVKPEMKMSDKFDFISSYFKRIAGGEYLGFSNSTFLSEREVADRNYALAFYMKENKCFPEKTNLRECIDLYFQLCSMEVNCESVSVMAATLANGGICPITGDKVLNSHAVRDTLSLMHSCGMYDYSGQFAFKVGLPAKSGVSGNMLLVIPNVMGMCLWSPPLDPLGNSVRGLHFCEHLVERFNFHRYDNLRYTFKKQDPRRQKYESKGSEIVTLLFGAASGDISALSRHRLTGMDMSQSDYDGRTALHLACAEGHLEVVQFLLRLCKVPSAPKDRWGNAPIDDARKFKHSHIIKFIEEYLHERRSEDSKTNGGVNGNKDLNSICEKEEIRTTAENKKK